MQRTYRVEFETDPQTKQVCVTLPTLNYTSDFGDTVEEALENLRELAQGFVELLLERGEPIPDSDPVVGEGVFLSLQVELPAPEPVAPGGSL